MIPLLEELAQANGLARDWLPAAVLVFLRVGAAMSLVPGFGEQWVPMRVRLALSVVFTMTTLPAVAGRLSGLDLLPAGAIEVAAGLILGIGLRLLIHCLQIAGAIAAQASSLAQLFGGAGVEPQPAIGHLLTIAGLALAVAFGLHVKLAALLISSYDLFPPGLRPAANEAAGWGIAHVSRSFALAFSIAAPFVLASAVYNLALGAINRAMPQLMVSFVGAPALAAGGLILLALAVAPALAIWREAVEVYLANPLAPPR